jgi:histidyl-tRNA synthetase
MSKEKSFARLPGFRDFVPEDLAIRNHIFRAWRLVSRRYGFVEYDGPPLEPLDLYVEKSGEEIVGQLYNFVDKGERDVTLRPEMTPTLARVLGERSRAMPKPIRWFTIPQLFRYERQQRGRLKEHFQWNVDIVGEGGVAADVEVVAVAIDALRELGLDAGDFHARVSDRRVLSALLRACGVAEEKLLVAYAVVDKLERDRAEVTAERLKAECGLDSDSVQQVLRIFRIDGLDALAESFPDNSEVRESVGEMRAYLDALASMGLGDYVTFDLRIVRGLAYYTGIVFELFDRKGELRAICGGGRYDRLLELVGGEPLPAVGFGMGDPVLTEFLQARGLIPEYRPQVDFYIVTIGAEQRPLALRLAHALRDDGKEVLYALRDQAVKKQFNQAGNAGAREAIILGPDEVSRGMAVVRDMETGGEREVPLEELLPPEGT